ncbi:MAG TPA: GntR family transcriptional regulator [Actinokineospora sp.]|nr:GntR family transcriptional regulator [Actinokineospora sp.]
MSTPQLRRTLSDQVADAVRQGIMAGTYEPGQRLVETELAKSLGVSQAPVREALKQLAHEGIVMQVPRRGSFVTSVDTAEARKTYELRAVLERVAATECCQSASDAALADLAPLVADIQAAADRGDPRGLIEADLRFHRTVWEVSGHPMLPRIWPMVEATTRSFAAVSNQLYFGDLKEIADAHVPLLDALTQRDADRASDLCHDHVVEVWRRIERSERD